MGLAQLQLAQAEKDKTRAVSIARKQRMLQLEEERKKRVPPTETEQIKNEKDQATLSQAQYKLEVRDRLEIGNDYFAQRADGLRLVG